MLYKDYHIEIWQSVWVDRMINGVNYSLGAYGFSEYKEVIKDFKYIALVWKSNPLKSIFCCGGSTPLIALDLARYRLLLLELTQQRSGKIK